MCIRDRVTLPTLAIYGVFIAQAAVNLVRPDWERFRLIVRLVADVAFLGIVIYLLQAHQWVMLARVGNATSAVLHTINQYVAYGLWVLVISVCIAVFVTFWQVLRYQPARSRGA